MFKDDILLGGMVSNPRIVLSLDNLNRRPLGISSKYLGVLRT